MSCSRWATVPTSFGVVLAELDGSLIFRIIEGIPDPHEHSVLKELELGVGWARGSEEREADSEESNEAIEFLHVFSVWLCVAARHSV